MKHQSALLPACLLLLLWTLTAFVSCADVKTKGKIDMEPMPDGIKLKCTEGLIKTTSGKQSEPVPNLELIYKDDNTGEYECVELVKDGSDSRQTLSHIYVKFRSCDNCMELDDGTIAGIVTGNLMATIVIGVAVYLVMSQTRTSPNTSHKKSSDRQHLVSNEMPRGTNDHYQVLNPRTRQGDTYGVLHK